MKRLKLLIFFAVLALTTNAQSSRVTLARDLHGKQYEGKEEIFENGIGFVGFSSDNRYVAISTKVDRDNAFSKGKSFVSLYDMERRCVLWHHQVKGTAKVAIPTPYGVFANVGGKVQVLDLGAGISKDELAIRPVYLNDSLDIILGYKGGSDKKLECHRLSNRELLWQGKVDISHSFGWDETLELPGNRLLVVADDINVIDLLTGEIVTHKAETGYTKGSIKVGGVFSSIFAQALLAIGTFALSGGNGYFTIMADGPGYDASVVNHLSSNIYQQDSCFYIADHTCLRAFDKNMTPLWEYRYPTGKASKSILFGDYGTVYMLNMGYGISGIGETVKNSRPFIASLTSHTGEPFFFTPLTMKKEILNDAMITPWEAWYLLDDGLVFQRDINDSIVSPVDWDIKKKGRICEAVHDTIFVKNDSTKRMDAVWCDWKQLPICLENGNVVVVNQNLKEVTTYPREKVYYQTEVNDRYRFVGRKKDKTTMEVWMMGMGNDPTLLKLTKGCRQVWMRGNTVFYTTDRSLCQFEVE